jgi:hypothetical protein
MSGAKEQSLELHRYKHIKYTSFYGEAALTVMPNRAKKAKFICSNPSTGSIVGVVLASVLGASREELLVLVALVCADVDVGVNVKTDVCFVCVDGGLVDCVVVAPPTNSHDPYITPKSSDAKWSNKPVLKSRAPHGQPGHCSLTFSEIHLLHLAFATHLVYNLRLRSLAIVLDLYHLIAMFAVPVLLPRVSRGHYIHFILRTGEFNATICPNSCQSPIYN